MSRRRTLMLPVSFRPARAASRLRRARDRCHGVARRRPVTGMVKGKVVDAKGQPVEAAKVTIEFKDGISRTYKVKTQQEGRVHPDRPAARQLQGHRREGEGRHPGVRRPRAARRPGRGELQAGARQRRRRPRKTSPRAAAVKKAVRRRRGRQPQRRQRRRARQVQRGDRASCRPASTATTTSATPTPRRRTGRRPRRRSRRRSS